MSRDKKTKVNAKHNSLRSLPDLMRFYASKNALMQKVVYLYHQSCTSNVTSGCNMPQKIIVLDNNLCYSVTRPFLLMPSLSALCFDMLDSMAFKPKKGDL